MSEPGPWLDPPPGAEYRPGLPTLRSANGQGVEFRDASPGYSVSITGGGGRIINLGQDAAGNNVTYSTSDRPTSLEAFTYNSFPQSAVMRWALRELFDRLPMVESPSVVLGVTPPEGAIGYEWEGDAGADYEVDFGPWTPTAGGRLVTPRVQDGDAYGEAAVFPPPGGVFIDTPPLLVTFKVALYPGSAMTLGPSTDSNVLIGDGPSFFTLPGDVQDFLIPPRPFEVQFLAVPLAPEPVRVSPGPGDWVAVGVYGDWWPDRYDDDPYRHTAEADLNYVTFTIYRDLPRYRWLFPSPFDTGRYGWGVLAS